MKALAVIMLVVLIVPLAACAGTAASSPPPNGTELGNSGIHVSGYVEGGGTVRPR